MQCQLKRCSAKQLLRIMKKCLAMGQYVESQSHSLFRLKQFPHLLDTSNVCCTKLLLENSVIVSNEPHFVENRIVSLIIALFLH